MNYLHKDFHGCLSTCLIFIQEHYGKDTVKNYLYEIGKSCYPELIEEIRRKGIQAWKKFIQDMYTAEGADFSIEDMDEGFVLKVNLCPAISYIKNKGMPLLEDFCITTREVNRAIATESGVEFSVEHDCDAMKCTQYFLERRS